MIDLEFLMRTIKSVSYQAITVAERIKILPQIQDARIVAASSEAATFYGVADAHLLMHKWLSQLQHIEDIHLSRLLSTARHQGLHVPKAYACRTRQPDGTFRLVTKRVWQYEVNDQLYWVTVLSEPKTPLLRKSDLQPLLRIAEPIIAQFVGTMTIVELEAFLQRAATAASLSPAVREAPSLSREAQALEEAVAAWLLIPEAEQHSIELPLGQSNYRRWLHRCIRCSQTWVAETAAPQNCGRCNSPYWATPRRRRHGST